MLKIRILTALFLLPAVLVLLFFGSEKITLSVFMLFIGITIFELLNIILVKMEAIFSGDKIEKQNISAWKKLHFQFFLVSFLICISVFFGFVVFGTQGAFVSLSLGILFIILSCCFWARSIESSFGRMLSLLIIVCYTVIPWIFIWDLYRMSPNGKSLIFALFIVICSDTGGYFGGRLLGKRKLAPSISPNKTVEGALAALISSTFGAYFSAEILNINLGSCWVLFVIGFFGGIFTQLGDLVESLFKRFAEVKDSGTIFPGHGGLLDRVDGLFFAAPIIWFILYVR
ncbi:MAG: phosphatidate cytidylyltransferase [Oligoflexales bacterium]|nr:phosphatidate cytidylyltransferase [Oligoflexales bacterium]